MGRTKGIAQQDAADERAHFAHATRNSAACLLSCRSFGLSFCPCVSRVLFFPFVALFRVVRGTLSRSSSSSSSSFPPFFLSFFLFAWRCNVVQLALLAAASFCSPLPLLSRSLFACCSLSAKHLLSVAERATGFSFSGAEQWIVDIHEVWQTTHGRSDGASRQMHQFSLPLSVHLTLLSLRFCFRHHALPHCASYLAVGREALLLTSFEQ